MRNFLRLIVTCAACILYACGGGGDQSSNTIMLYKYLRAMEDTPATANFVESMQRQLGAQGISVYSTACGWDGSSSPQDISKNGNSFLLGIVGIVEVSEASAQVAANFGYRPLSEIFYVKRDCRQLFEGGTL